MALKPITVSQLNDYISRIVGRDPLLSSVLVKGEVSGVKYHGSGYVFFSLLDDYSKVSCFMPQETAGALDFRLEDGMEVEIRGNVSVYKKGGYYSLFVRELSKSGAGARAEAFEKLKKKLEAEGLFDPRKKKPIPFFPRNVAVITSDTGAAVRDILKIIKSRNDVVNVLIFPVNVQGPTAAPQISEAIRRVNEDYNYMDVIIEGRGGGSAEDLSCFNDEGLARAIFASRIPVISAVGHEIDFTISDFVADYRAETPTAAAQKAVPDTSELRDELESIREGMIRSLKNEYEFDRMKLENMKDSMRNSLMNMITGYEADIKRYAALIEANDPRAILKRGYSITEDSSGRVVMDASELNKGDVIKVTFASGSAEAEVTKTNGER
ncbi:MAG: exodeoxyribonuclease VII large subunit [Eubacteriales bacterium]|nr:exodeoxyribonuclease VII large subunit [Eubacteriales bacterium]